MNKTEELQLMLKIQGHILSFYDENDPLRAFVEEMDFILNRENIQGIRLHNTVEDALKVLIESPTFLVYNLDMAEFLTSLEIDLTEYNTSSDYDLYSLFITRYGKILYRIGKDLL